MEIKPISSYDIESLSRIYFAEKNEYIKYFLPFKSKEELKKLKEKWKNLSTEQSSTE